MSDLIVFYSLSGKSRQVAEWLAGGLKAEVDRIAEEQPRDFAFRGLIRSGIDSLLRRQPGIRPMRHREGIFDRVILACPVWGGRIAGPARTWLHKHGRAARALGLALQSGTGAAYGDVLKEFEDVVGRPPSPLLTVGEADFGNKIAEKKVADFVRSIAIEAARFPTS
jgi:hypothetical protein